MKVSIVMPVYNASSYLREALDSIVNQSYRELEIICVDDGSTDDSFEILEQYQKSDDRIKIIKQQNQYAGAARNAGLAEATGEYIMFLDSDDVFENNMISYLVKKAKKHKPDIIVFGYWRFTDNVRRKRPVRNHYRNGMLVSGDDIKESIFQQSRTMPWDKFLRLDFVRESGLKYKQTKVNNDIYFNQMIVSEAGKILFCTKRLVNYRINNKQSLQGNLNKNPTEFINAFSDVKDELNRRGTYGKYQHSFNTRIVEDIIVHLQRIKSYDEFKMIVERLSGSGLVEHSDEFENNQYTETFRQIKDCNVNECLASVFSQSMENMVSRNSAAYQMGNKLLKVFRLTY